MWKYLSWLKEVGKQSRTLGTGCIRSSSAPSDCWDKKLFYEAGQGQLLENWSKAFRVRQTLAIPCPKYSSLLYDLHLKEN